MLLVAGAGAVAPAIPDRGSDSAPGVFPLPQLGSAGARRNFSY